MSDQQESSDLDVQGQRNIQNNANKEAEIIASVPFSLELSLNLLQGAVSLAKSFVRLEWRMYDMFETPKGDLQTLDIAIERIQSITFKKRWTGSKLTLLMKSAADLQNFPMPSGALTELECKIKRKHAQVADLLAAEASIILADFGL